MGNETDARTIRNTTTIILHKKIKHKIMYETIIIPDSDYRHTNSFMSQILIGWTVQLLFPEVGCRMDIFEKEAYDVICDYLNKRNKSVSDNDLIEIRAKISERIKEELQKQKEQELGGFGKLMDYQSKRMEELKRLALEVVDEETLNNFDNLTEEEKNEIHRKVAENIEKKFKI